LLNLTGKFGKCLGHVLKVLGVKVHGLCLGLVDDDL
jgi:hypothetical protein